VLDFLFGEGQYGLRFVFAFIVVMGLIGLFTWLARRFGATSLGATTARGRQPRLAVIDAAAVDGRRRLLLIRRDNVEHLLMIGGPTDVVVETNIVRAGAMREAAPGRQPAAADTLPRPVPLEETGTWPLQPETAHASHGTPRRGSPLPLDEPNVAWPEEAEPAPMPRQARALDPLAGLAAELSRNPPEPAPAMAPLPRVTRPREVTRESAREAPLREPPLREPPLREPPLREPPVREMPAREFAREVPRDMPREVPREVAREVHREVAREAPREVAREAMREPIREVVREPLREAVREPIREPMREAMREPIRESARAPQQAAAEAPASADQNLAEMAHRLEAALRRPGAKAEARAEPKPRPVAEAMAEPSPLEATPSEARREGKAPPQQRSLYDSLEQEMASLLGRPNSKA
jgi:flagellar protein FliO/FliZ